MIFSELTGIYYIGYELLLMDFLTSLISRDGVGDVYGFETLGYLENIAMLQLWIFGILYWKSAEACSLKATCFTDDNIIVVGVFVAVIYLLTQTIFYVIDLVTFPTDSTSPVQYVQYI
jgi:hypothetical protein